MIPSLFSVIPDLLSTSKVKILLSECSDWREIMNFAARQKNVTPEALTQKVAGLLNLPYHQEVSAFNLALLPYPIEALRVNACIPIVIDCKLAGFAAVDPVRVLNVCPDCQRSEISLATWVNIKSALDQSEQIYRASSQNDALLRGILELLVNEVESFHQHQAFLDFYGDEIVYQFLTDRGCNAKGSIGSQVREPLFRFIEKLAAGSTSLHLGDRLDFSLFAQVVDAEMKRFLLSWRAVENSSTEPPLHDFTTQESPIFVEENRKPNLLIVEDNQTFAEVLRQYFEKRGIGVTQAFGGEQAQALLTNGRHLVDCVLCDLHMPKLNGLDLLLSVRHSASRPNLPFLLLTSDDNVESQLAAIEKGADGYLTKHQDPRLIHAYVTRALSKAQKGAMC